MLEKNKWYISHYKKEMDNCLPSLQQLGWGYFCNALKICISIGIDPSCRSLIHESTIIFDLIMCLMTSFF